MPAVPSRHGPPIASAGQARRAVRSVSGRKGWAIAIARGHGDGPRVMLHALDQAQYGSIPVARAKAGTTVKLRSGTQRMEDAVAAGESGMRSPGRDIRPRLDGGPSPMRGGGMIGAMRESRMRSVQDAHIAQAGVDGLLEHDA